MFCVFTEVMVQDDTVIFEFFSFYLCLWKTSPNYAFMRRRLYISEKSKNIILSFDVATLGVT